ncbi:hypothetical protein B0H17DRAFT_1288711 [Mycena rosella]|uniref:acetate--CoA ligase n=1 Tax=Mycena rosella TaxID=1033263 RepID=A0AAD7FHC9_MYCRO|nr:hypothetical protein B0H17DRAFT_1288711 [Mycena rosella]
MQQESRELLYWDRPFKTVRSVGFATGDIAWLPEDWLNASYNCVDRWVSTHPDRVSFAYRIVRQEANSCGSQSSIRRMSQAGCSITYAELLREVCSLANVLKSFGVCRRDTVSIYLPMTWHAAAAFLACARIGVKYVFDVHKGNRFAYMADVGWITGHTCVSFLSLVQQLPSQCRR